MLNKNGMCPMCWEMQRKRAASTPGQAAMYGSCYFCPVSCACIWYKSQPQSNHPGLFHRCLNFSASQEDVQVVILAVPVLFPLGSNFCPLHWNTLAPPFNLQLDAVVLVSVAP